MCKDSRDRAEIFMDNFYEKIARYNSLVINADDIVSFDVNNGVIVVDKSVFDDFIKDTVINVYCADIHADSIMEFVMTEENDDGITMSMLDRFNI